MDRSRWEEAYWRGSTDEKLRAIMDRMEAVENKVDTLMAFRAKVVAIGCLISAIVSLITQLVMNQ